jgi:ketosteroid isomerase-like protein
MVKRLTLLCLAALVWAVPAGAQSREVQSDQEILAQLERDWDAAVYKKDLKFIETILAEEFIATYNDGSRADKARELALTAALNQQIESSRVDDIIVRTYGNTAVVLFTKHLVGMSQGSRLELRFRYMDVFVQRDGRWVCVASQDVKVEGQP